MLQISSETLSPHGALAPSTAREPCHCSSAQLELKASASSGSGYISDVKWIPGHVGAPVQYVF